MRWHGMNNVVNQSISQSIKQAISQWLSGCLSMQPVKCPDGVSQFTGGSGFIVVSSVGNCVTVCQMLALDNAISITCVNQTLCNDDLMHVKRGRQVLTRWLLMPGCYCGVDAGDIRIPDNRYLQQQRPGPGRVAEVKPFYISTVVPTHYVKAPHATVLSSI
eukprot:scaffold655034_cov61-Prasinocladus_malaysianus.AAC.1